MTSTKTARMLQISKDLGLPPDAVTSTLVIFGGKGMGKTNLLSVIAEEVARTGHRFSLIDPMGVCWGLRHDATGKGPGVEVLILGGRHGDLPIEPTGGVVVADLVVDEDVSVVIDISRRADGRSWGKNEKIRFVRDYCTRLFERQGERRRPLLQIIDEAARFIPQMIRANEPETAACSGAVAQMVEEGRNNGIGVCLISQRSARMSKDVTELADCMIAFRTVGPNSVAAIVDWFGEHVPKERQKGLVEQLRTLPRGSALVVSPGWLDFEGVAAIRARGTFDSSATPKAGQERRTAGKGAQPDLARYEQRMAETIEKANSENPSILRKRLAEAEAKVRKLESQPAPNPVVAKKSERVEVPILKDAQIDKLESLAARVITEAQKLLSLGNVIVSAIGFRTSITEAPAKPPVAAPIQRSVPAAPPPPPRQAKQPAGDGSIGKCERAILSVLAQFPEGCQKGKLALLAGYRYSGGFRNALSTLRKNGWIVGDNEAVMKITGAGVEAVGDFERLPSGQALVDYWVNHPSLGKAERAILRFLTETRESFTGLGIASHVGYEFSGGFRNSLSTLRTAGLITGNSNMAPIAAAPELLS